MSRIGWRLGAMAVALACAAAAASTGCAARKSPSDVPEGPAVSVDVQDLWKKESTKDPIQAYRARVAADPDNAGLHNNLGNAYVQENRMDEALREFRAAARLDDRSPVPWNNIGTTYRKLGKRAQAETALRKAIDLDPRYALAWYNLGTIYDDAGDYDKAIELYLKALALKPELADVRFNPQVVENRHLTVVKLRHFLEESGNIALPLDRLPE